MSWWLLLADSETLRRVSESSRKLMSSSDSWVLSASLAAIILLWLAWSYWDRYRCDPRWRSNDPRMLAQELCRAHRLDRNERALLWKAVEEAELQQPALAFVDPDVLRRLVRSDGPEAGRYRGLMKKLFGRNVL